MRLLAKSFFTVLAVIPLASSAGLSVNGSCQVGNCTSPDTVASGAAETTAFNFTITLANTDQYRIIGNVNAAAGSGNTLSLVSPFLVMYLGTKSGTASGADVITLDVLQSFKLDFTLRQADEVAEGGFGGALAAGSSSQSQLSINGQALPLMGPFLAPASFSFKSTQFTIAATTAPVFVVHHVFTFAAGSGVGATIFNALTPSTTNGGGSADTSPSVCDSSSSSTSGCAIVACDGSGSSLPIYRKGSEQPQARASDNPAGSYCSIIRFDGSGGTLPLLFPTGGSGSGDTSTVVFADGNNETGSGGSLPILYPTGTGGGNQGTVIAFDGAGSSLPILRGPEAVRAAVTAAYSIQIATPFQAAPASYTVSATCADSSIHCWITIPFTSGTVAAASRTAITATIDRNGLAAGTYTATVTITITPQGQSAQTVNVPVTLAIAAPGPYLMLSQTGIQFSASGGSAAVQSKTISVSNAGAGVLSFNASVAGAASKWLSVSPVSGTTNSGPAQVTIQANPTGLGPGIYSGLVQFSGSSVVNGIQSVEVMLTVSASAPPPTLSSNALVFVTNVGTNPAPQPVQLVNSSSSILTIAPTVGFSSGGGWLTATGSGTTVSASQPLTEMVLVNSGNLAAGIYRGSLNLHVVETNADEMMEILLIVRPAVCHPTRLLPVITNLGGDFRVMAGMPVPLAVNIVDDCGAPVSAGAVMAYFPGGELGVPLTSAGAGLWSGTWMPHSIDASTSATVAILATAGGLAGSAGVLGSVSANPSAPVIFQGGAVNSANYAEAPLAPGGRISIFGENLAAQPAENDTSPYPFALGGAQVMLGGEALPMQVAVPGLINAIVPYDLPIGVPQQLIVQQGNALSVAENVVLGAAQPAVFTLNASGRGPGVIVVLKPDGSFFVNGSGKAASAGDILIIYCTGLGIVDPAVPLGQAASVISTSSADATTTVSIGGISAPVGFAGLAPGFVGVYQINATVPAGVSPGSNIPLVVSAGGASSAAVSLAIQ